MEEKIPFGVHKINTLPESLIKGHLYFESSTKSIHVAISETEKETFGVNPEVLDSIWNALDETNIKKITENLPENVKEAYILTDEKGNQKGDLIPVYKNSSLKSAELVDENLVFTYVLSDGSESVITVDISKFLSETEFTEGLKIEAGKVSIKISDVENNYLNMDDSGLSVTGMESDVITTAEDIIVAGGPLSNLLTSAGIKTITKGTDLQSLLFSLFCKELWPTNISSTAGLFSAKSGVESFSITTTSPSLVEPGTIIYFSATQGSVNGYSTTNPSVSGLTYGYSTSNDNTKEGSTSSFSKSWSVTPGESSYSLTLSGGESPEKKTGTSPQTISNYPIIAKIGTNTCSASASGSVTYNGSVAEIPVYYGVSNIGNTSESYKSILLSEQTKSVTSSGTSSASKSVTGVYPCYHNVSSGSLLDDTTTKLALQTTTTFTIQNIPSEESFGKNFMFDFPANASISNLTITPIPTKYKVYSNINGTAIGSSFNNDHGAWSSSMTFNVPKESGSSRFAIEYPAGVSIKQLLRHNDATGKDDVYSLYKTESVKRGNDSYIRLTMTHDSAQGASQYKISFNTPVSKTSSDYEITSGITKTINGTNYNYKRLTTTSKEGWVNRSITFTKSLNNV